MLILMLRFSPILLLLHVESLEELQHCHKALAAGRGEAIASSKNMSASSERPSSTDGIGTAGLRT